jgi:hypothetical protein
MSLKLRFFTITTALCVLALGAAAAAAGPTVQKRYLLRAIASAGSSPPDSARKSWGAYFSKNACAICERPALWVQTKSTYFTLFLLEQD